MLLKSCVIGLALVFGGNAHTVISYPGWRGNNLGITDEFPYGMQWSYPCGGIPTSTNRTKWPLTGGGIAIQPGWFQGHSTALFYINLGLGTDGPGGGPPNMSFPMVPLFEVVGPTDNPYPGTFCLPQVPLPKGVNVKVGDKATIQVVEAANHGGALYNCVDIIFALPADVPALNASNCFNSTDISIKNPFAATPCSNSSSVVSTVTLSTPSCTVCPVCITPSPSSCPVANQDSGTKMGNMMGFSLAAFAIGILWFQVMR